MQFQAFPRMALVLGAVLGGLVVFGSAPGGDGATTLPLLTLLVASEFGFIVTAIGAGMSFREIRRDGAQPGALLTAFACSGLALFLVLRGLALWPA